MQTLWVRIQRQEDPLSSPLICPQYAYKLEKSSVSMPGMALFSRARSPPLFTPSQAPVLHPCEVIWLGCCSLQGFGTHQTLVPVFIQYKQAPGQQGKWDHSQEETNMVESLDGVSEQCDDIAECFGRPGIGEIIYKATHKELQP